MLNEMLHPAQAPSANRLPTQSLVLVAGGPPLICDALSQTMALALPEFQVRQLHTRHPGRHELPVHAVLLAPGTDRTAPPELAAACRRADRVLVVGPRPAWLQHGHVIQLRADASMPCLRAALDLQEQAQDVCHSSFVEQQLAILAELGLTAANLAVWRLILQDGLSLRELAATRHRAEVTLKAHVRRGLRALGARNREDALRKLQREAIRRQALRSSGQATGPDQAATFARHGHA